MKKLVFVVVRVFIINIFFESVWAISGVPPQGHPQFSQRSQIRRPNTNATNHNKSHNPRSAPLQRSGSQNNLQPQPLHVLDIRLTGDTVRQVLGDIIVSFPAKNVNTLNINIRSFLMSNSLDSNENARKARSILENAQSYFERVYHHWSTLYQKLFNEFPNTAELESNTVALKDIQAKLNLLKLDKLREIISVYNLYGNFSEKSIKENLQYFSEYIEKSKAIIEEMNGNLTRKVLNQIEGLPELPNLKKTNTFQNLKLLEQSGIHNISNQITDTSSEYDSAYSGWDNTSVSYNSHNYNNQMINPELFRELSITQNLTKKLLNMIEFYNLSKKLDYLISFLQRWHVNTQ